MAEIEKKAILVTGASGYLGSALCQRLITEGKAVHGVSRKKRGSDNPLIHWWQADLSESGAAEYLLEKTRPKTIIHLAALPDGARDLDLVIPTFRSNALATVNLLKAAADFGCEKFLYCGSMEEPHPGDAVSVPNSPYAASKMVGSAYARMFYELYSLPVVLLRVFLVYGPGLQKKTKLIPYSIISLLKENPPKLSSGRRTIDAVYINDVMDAFLAALERDDICGRLIDIGSGNQITIRKVIDKIAKIIDNGIKPDYGSLIDRPQEMMPVANTAATYKILGWKPRTSLDQGLSKTIEWYKNVLAKDKL